VRITDQRLDIVTCRWLDDTGRYELISPWFSGPANPGPALRPDSSRSSRRGSQTLGSPLQRHVSPDD